MIWSRLSILAAVFPTKAVAASVSRRWRKIGGEDGRLKEDLIRLGGVLILQPVQDGEPQPLDPLRLAYEAGRRDFAMQLLALMGTSFDDMNRMMEDDDV